MRASHIAVRAALLLGAAGAGVALWSAADATAAYAADRPAAVEQPGGLLDGAVHLPAQAADRAQDVVDEVVPGPAKPDKPKPEPKPTKDQTPPADEPTHAPKPPTEPPVEVPPVDVPPVVVDPPPVVIEPTPIPTVPAPIPTPTLPVEDLPATPTAPAAEPTLPVTLPTLPVVQPAALPTAVLPAVVPPLPGLPILIGPTAAPAAPIDPARAHDEPVVAALTAEVPLCADDLNAVHIDLRRIRIPLDLRGHTDKAIAAGPSGPPCPGTPNGPTDLAGGPSAITAGSSSQSGTSCAATAIAALPWPALHVLYQLRPRGDLPASRPTHLDPRPA